MSSMEVTITAPGVYERTWTAGNSTFGALSIVLPGRVVVTHDPRRNDTATVVVSSSSKELLDLVLAEVAVGVAAGIIDDDDQSDENGNVLINDSKKELKLSLATRNTDAKGTLLVHVILRHPVPTLSTTAETILQDGAMAVLHGTSSVKLATYSDQDVWFASSGNLAVESLSLTAGGAGNLYVIAPFVDVEKNLKLTVFRSGSLVLNATQIHADSIKSEVPGSGSIYVQSNLQANHLITDVLGSGSINMYSSGRCIDNSIEILGSGSAYVASIACTSTSVNTLGNGDAYIQTEGTLTRSGFGSGSILYFNGTPLHLPEVKDPRLFPFVREPRVLPTSENKYNLIEIATKPSVNEGIFVQVPLSTAWHFWPPNNNFQQLQDMTTVSFYSILPLVFLVVLLGMALRSIASRTQRHAGYQVV